VESGPKMLVSMQALCTCTLRLLLSLKDSWIDTVKVSLVRGRALLSSWMVFKIFDRVSKVKTSSKVEGVKLAISANQLLRFQFHCRCVSF